MKVPKARKLSSGNWFIQLRLGGESIPVTARTEKECTRQAQYLKAEYKAGKRQAPPERPAESPKAPTVKEAIDAYIKKRDAVLSPVTIRGYRNIQKSRFHSVMDREITSISGQEWQAICNEEAKLCSPKTLKNAWGFLVSVISESTDTQPPKIKLPQVVVRERPFLEPEQIRPFIDAVHGTDIEIPALLALSSLRRSEIMALRWENIDLDRKIIKVRGATVPDEHHKLTQKKENKNASSARNVPIMIDDLQAALSMAKQDSGLIISHDANTVCRNINKICHANGLPSVGIHGLRHSFVSLAYHLGVPEKIVMEIGGWADYQTMRNIYTHIAKSDVSRYTDQFSGFFSGRENANKNAN